MERIVVGVDGAESALEALRWAVAEARRRNATVEAVYAWHQPFAGYATMGELDNLGFQKEAQEVLTRALSS